MVFKATFNVLWMDEILHQFETMGNRLFVGILQGNHHSRVSSVVQDSVHSTVRSVSAPRALSEIAYAAIPTKAGWPGPASPGEPSALTHTWAREKEEEEEQKEQKKQWHLWHGPHHDGCFRPLFRAT